MTDTKILNESFKKRLSEVILGCNITVKRVQVGLGRVTPLYASYSVAATLSILTEYSLCSQKPQGSLDRLIPTVFGFILNVLEVVLREPSIDKI